MKADKLKPGDGVGIISPCHTADREQYAPFIQGLRGLGFEVKEGRNLYRRTYGYAASEAERAEDLHDMVRDSAVKLILFGGGCVGNEFLPMLDYGLIKRNPKLICSYSNGTTLLNTIYANTGLVTYYGQFPGVFAALGDYDRKQFLAWFVEGQPQVFSKNSDWLALCGGQCGGILIGGYTTRFAMLLGNRYFSYDEKASYVLFLENNERFHDVGAVMGHLAHIEQHPFMSRVTGLLFGNYASGVTPALNEGLRRFGERNGIPVIKCDDFGHGVNHGILPIGAMARLDAHKGELLLE